MCRRLRLNLRVTALGGQGQPRASIRSARGTSERERYATRSQATLAMRASRDDDFVSRLSRW